MAWIAENLHRQQLSNYFHMSGPAQNISLKMNVVCQTDSGVFCLIGLEGKRQQLWQPMPWKLILNTLNAEKPNGEWSVVIRELTHKHTNTHKHASSVSGSPISPRWHSARLVSALKHTQAWLGSRSKNIKRFHHTEAFRAAHNQRRTCQLTFAGEHIENGPKETHLLTWLGQCETPPPNILLLFDIRMHYAMLNWVKIWMPYMLAPHQSYACLYACFLE